MASPNEAPPLAGLFVAGGCTAVMALGILFACGAAADETALSIAPFSAASPGAPLPAPWRLTAIPGVERATQYALVADGGSVVLRAHAQAAMASLTHPLKVDPDKFPFISWRWKISNVLQKSDLRSKIGDDFPARVYVLFDFDIGKLSIVQRAKMYLARKRYGVDVPSAALCYVWDGKAPVGTALWSPYTDRVRVIVVESGSQHLDRWREVERDLRADFRAAFGEEPPPVSGVAIASDTDNTGEAVSALFGDIRLHAQPRAARSGAMSPGR